MRACWSRQVAHISRCRVTLCRSFSISARPRAESPATKRDTVQAPDSKKPQRILSGIQPTGVPHLGNYLGALRQWKDFQDESISEALSAQRAAAKSTQQEAVNGAQKEVANSSRKQPYHRLYYSIVDLHALTGTINGVDRNQLRKESFASLLAIGLSPNHSNLFFQSDVSHHTELMWILSTIASTGYLSRMTQWKSKLSLDPTTTLFSDSATKKLKLGLFSYPVLQAADILLYKPTLVPVGEDQAQHIEFARTLARGFNAHFGPIPSPYPGKGDSNATTKQRFVFDHIPEPLISPAKRIMSLRNPSKKMSKSDKDPNSRILITDSPHEIHNKLKNAVTDSRDGISYDRQNRPGISNLIEILKHTTRSELSCDEIAKEHQGMSKQTFKTLVANAIIKELEGIREKFEDVMKPGSGELREAYHLGTWRARVTAGHTLSEVKRTLGLQTLE